MKKRFAILATLLLALLVAVWLVPSEVESQPEGEILATSTMQYAEPEESTTPELLPALKPICACESVGKKDGTPTHYESDGITVLRGRINSDDVGMCQINLKWHEETATQMGLDLFKEKDNITYANFLYTTQGNEPWGWSKHCWE